MKQKVLEVMRKIEDARCSENWVKVAKATKKSRAIWIRFDQETERLLVKEGSMVDFEIHSEHLYTEWVANMVLEYISMCHK